MNEPCHVWMSHVTYRGAIPHINEPWHVWMSHITYEWVMAHMNEPCHISMSHWTYECSSACIHIYAYTYIYILTYLFGKLPDRHTLSHTSLSHTLSLTSSCSPSPPLSFMYTHVYMCIHTYTDRPVGLACACATKSHLSFSHPLSSVLSLSRHVWMSHVTHEWVVSHTQATSVSHSVAHSLYVERECVFETDRGRKTVFLSGSVYTYIYMYNIHVHAYLLNESKGGQQHLPPHTLSAFLLSLSAFSLSGSLSLFFYAHKYIHLYPSLHIHVDMDIHINMVYIHPYIYRCIYIHIHPYPYIDIHTYMFGELTRGRQSSFSQRHTLSFFRFLSPALALFFCVHIYLHVYTHITWYSRLVS